MDGILNETKKTTVKENISIDDTSSKKKIHTYHQVK